MRTRIERNLTRRINSIDNRARSGIRAATLHVKSKMLPITPVDTGNLRNSAFTRIEDDGGEPVGVVGFTAAYAPFVHECVECEFQAPRAEPRFLARTLQRERDEIQRLIRDFSHERNVE